MPSPATQSPSFATRRIPGVQIANEQGCGGMSPVRHKTEVVNHSFLSILGHLPQTQGGDGAVLYGTAPEGGNDNNGQGTVYRIDVDKEQQKCVP
jgi:hypothetical protein